MPMEAPPCGWRCVLTAVHRHLGVIADCNPWRDGSGTPYVCPRGCVVNVAIAEGGNTLGWIRICPTNGRRYPGGAATVPHHRSVHNPERPIVPATGGRDAAHLRDRVPTVFEDLGALTGFRWWRAGACRQFTDPLRDAPGENRSCLIHIHNFVPPVLAVNTGFKFRYWLVVDGGGTRQRGPVEAPTYGEFHLESALPLAGISLEAIGTPKFQGPCITQLEPTHNNVLRFCPWPTAGRQEVIAGLGRGVVHLHAGERGSRAEEPCDTPALRLQLVQDRTDKSPEREIEIPDVSLVRFRSLVLVREIIELPAHLKPGQGSAQVGQRYYRAGAARLAFRAAIDPRTWTLRWAPLQLPD